MPGHFDPADLSVALTAFNSARTIGRTLESVRGLAGRIVVVDSGSTDATLDICRAAGAEVIHRQWQGCVLQTRFSLEQCQSPWVLLLDSDESVEPELAGEIRRVVAENDPAISGWYINRKLWFLGAWLHYTYQPEWRMRLVRREAARVVGEDPHSLVEAAGRHGRLRGDLRHDSWADVRQLAERQIVYAHTMAGRGARGGRVLDLLFRPPAALARHLILQRGILDGWRGMIVAAMSANYTMLKHIFIAARRFQASTEGHQGVSAAWGGNGVRAGGGRPAAVAPGDDEEDLR